MPCDIGALIVDVLNHVPLHALSKPLSRSFSPSTLLPVQLGLRALHNRLRVEVNKNPWILRIQIFLPNTSSLLSFPWFSRLPIPSVGLIELHSILVRFDVLIKAVASILLAPMQAKRHRLPHSRPSVFHLTKSEDGKYSQPSASSPAPTYTTIPPSNHPSTPPPTSSPKTPKQASTPTQNTKPPSSTTYP